VLLLSEESAPRGHVRPAPEQRTPLPLGHPAPHAELDPVVQGVGEAFEYHRAVPADHRCFALRGTAHEEFIGVGAPAERLGDPGDPALVLHAA
jgi:hypothetical protein